MMSKKYLRDLFNQRHTRCRYCQKLKVEGLARGNARQADMKALFHPRPWMSQAQCSRQLNILESRCIRITRNSRNVILTRERFIQTMQTTRRLQPQVDEQQRLLFNSLVDGENALFDDRRPEGRNTPNEPVPADAPNQEQANNLPRSN